MSSVSETNIKMLESKPYLTKSEVGTLLAKKGKNLDKKIALLFKKQTFVRLKKGLYVSQKFLDKYQYQGYDEYLANVLYFPSYISLEYVLQTEGLIPEIVYKYTSISLKAPREFDNPVGNFSYRKIKEPLFTGYFERPFIQEYKIKQASKAKALFDWLYLRVFRASFEQELTTDLRINWDLFSRTELNEFASYVNLAKSTKMEKIYHQISNLITEI